MVELSGEERPRRIPMATPTPDKRAAARTVLTLWRFRTMPYPGTRSKKYHKVVFKLYLDWKKTRNLGAVTLGSDFKTFLNKMTDEILETAEAAREIPSSIKFSEPFVIRFWGQILNTATVVVDYCMGNGQTTRGAEKRFEDANGNGDIDKLIDEACGVDAMTKIKVAAA